MHIDINIKNKLLNNLRSTSFEELLKHSASNNLLLQINKNKTDLISYQIKVEDKVNNVYNQSNFSQTICLRNVSDETDKLIINFIYKLHIPNLNLTQKHLPPREIYRSPKTSS